jgi:putative DNA primase/helicase
MGGRQELVDYLQRWTGYCLTGDVSEQKLLFLYGNGSNGKSTFFHVLMQLLGDYASPSTPGLLLEHRNEQHPAAVAELAGQRLVVNSEAGQGKKLAEELLKRLTGSEPIKARFMNKDFFKFEPQYKLILSANHKPVIHGTDEAIWRRIPVVPFTAKFYEPGEGEPVKDFHIYEKLTNELPGIMNWAIAGCLAWQKSGMVAPEPVKEAAADYRAEMDILGAFLLESCERVDPSLSIRSGLLYERYKEWCSVSGETAVSQVIFSRAMIDRGFSKEKREQGIIWFGLRLADQGSEARN